MDWYNSIDIIWMNSIFDTALFSSKIIEPVYHRLLAWILKVNR